MLGQLPAAMPARTSPIASSISRIAFTQCPALSADRILQLGPARSAGRAARSTYAAAPRRRHPAVKPIPSRSRRTGSDDQPATAALRQRTVHGRFPLYCFRRRDWMITYADAIILLAGRAGNQSKCREPGQGRTPRRSGTQRGAGERLAQLRHLGVIGVRAEHRLGGQHQLLAQRGERCRRRRFTSDLQRDRQVLRQQP